MKSLQRNSDGASASRIQANSQKLSRDPATFLDLAEPVLLIEDAKSVRFHAAGQGVIDRRHDFGGDHRPPILPRQQGSGARKKILGPRSLELHQLDKGIVIPAGVKIGFRITKAREIFLRQINSSVVQV